MSERAGILTEGISLNGGGYGLESGTETGASITFFAFSGADNEFIPPGVRDGCAMKSLVLTIVNGESKRLQRPLTLLATFVGK